MAVAKNRTRVVIGISPFVRVKTSNSADIAAHYEILMGLTIGV